MPMRFTMPHPPPPLLLHIPLHIPHNPLRTPRTRTPTRPRRRRRTRRAPSTPPLARLQLIHILLLARQRLQPRLLTLGDQQTRQHTQEHEERENLHHAVDPGRGVIVARAPLDHGREEDLCKHGAQLAHSRAEAVARRAHAGREYLSGCDEGRGVGPEVEEELREDVER